MEMSAKESGDYAKALKKQGVIEIVELIFMELNNSRLFDQEMPRIAGVRYYPGFLPACHPQIKGGKEMSNPERAFKTSESFPCATIDEEEEMKYCENKVQIVETGGKMGKRTEIILEGLQEPTWILNPDPTDIKNQEILHLQAEVFRLTEENAQLKKDVNYWRRRWENRA